MAAAVASSSATGISTVAADSENGDSEDRSGFVSAFRLKIEKISPKEFSDIVSSTAIDRSELVRRMGKTSYTSLTGDEQELMNRLIEQGTLYIPHSPPQGIYNHRFILKEGDIFQVHLVQLS